MKILQLLKNKRDYSVFFFIFSSVLFIGAFINATELSAEMEVTTIEWTVNEGETLWSIANNMNEDENTPIQELVYWIKDLNNIEGNVIFPGQSLNIPVLYSKE